MSRYYPPVTVTGNPVNFSAPNGGKLDSVSVQIIPTQDLHGYANPWPGGGGKNLDPYDNLNNSTRLWGSNNSNQKSTFQSLPTGTYTMSCKFKVLTNHNSEANVQYGVLVRYSDGGGGYVNIIPYQLTTAPATVGAVYEWHKSFTLTESLAEQSTLAVYFYCASGGTSTVTANAYDIQIEKGDIANPTFAPYENICPISGLTGLSVYVSPTQDPDDATVYNVDWTTQAGTVYGGTLDVVTGVLTVDRVSVNLNPTAKYVTAYGYYWYTSVTQLSIGAISGNNAGLISNRLVAYTDITDTIPEGKITFYANGIIRWKEQGSLSKDDYVTYLASNPLQIVYELATPITYQLTPKQIAVLIGQNYIWSSNNETISVVYALLVPGSDKYTLIVNGVDIADFVERDSYRTTLYPVFSEAVQTLDGVGHTALLRKKGELSARFNPRTAADTAIICAALLNAPCEVQYHCLQRNADVTALMTIDSVSALYLSRCLYCRQKWNDIESITLTEL